jgi:hypothetical protein
MADNAMVQAPAEKKSPPPVALALAPAPFLFGKPIHPSGIVVEIVGTGMSCQGRSCEEHDFCGAGAAVTAATTRAGAVLSAATEIAIAPSDDMVRGCE